MLHDLALAGRPLLHVDLDELAVEDPAGGLGLHERR
jgi:hypothetical protein